MLYADKRKYLLYPGEKPFSQSRKDDKGGQYVDVLNSAFGMTIRIPRKWTSLCQRLVTQHKVTSIELGNFDETWSGELRFVNDIPLCSNLSITYSIPLDFSALQGNRNLEGLDLDFLGKGDPGRFDLKELPRLRRCTVPAHEHFSSAFGLSQMVSLYIKRGEHKGRLDLRLLTNLKELGCINVSKVTRLQLSSATSLRVLTLAHVRELEAVEPTASVTKELLDLHIERAPKFQLDWLERAKSVECVSLKVGQVPSIKFLSELRHLQVLSLFGTKVLDGDLSLLDRLPRKLDSRYWSDR